MHPGEVGHVAAGPRHAAERLAKVIHDHEMVPRPARDDGSARNILRVWGVLEDALEDFDQLEHAHLEPGFLAQFALDALDQRLTHFEGAAGNGPFALERLAAAADEHSTAVGDHHAAHAHYRLIRKFASVCHRHLLGAPPDRGPAGAGAARRAPRYSSAARFTIATKGVI